MPAGNITPATAAICPGEQVVLKTVPGFTYQWFYNGAPVPAAVADSFAAGKPGNYTVTLTDAGCAANYNATVTAKATKAGMHYGLMRVARYLPLTLQARPGGQNYSWSPAIDLDNPSIVNPVLSAGLGRRYLVTISSPQTCTYTDTLDVEVYKAPAVYVPDGFTPNGDGLNDMLRPIPVHQGSMIRFTVFNRWGELVFETRKEGEGWDGIYQGIKQPTASYAWYYEGTDKKGNKVLEKGTFTLIR
jgi:gliding motility-associated-like protein